MSQAAGQPLIIDAVTQRYGSFLAVDNVTLDIKAGELIALLGPSGCGKTTLLRIIAGFITQTEGHVFIGENKVDELPPNRREVGIVFQNYALFPHMTIADNIAYGLAARGMPKAEQEARVKEMLALIQLTHIADRFPKQLSGGQQQRVALARALAVKPNILLLDEPFAALDKNLRLDMQIEIKRIQRLAGTTTVLVTHDQEEALRWRTASRCSTPGQARAIRAADRGLRRAVLAVREHLRRHRQHAARQADRRERRGEGCARYRRRDHGARAERADRGRRSRHGRACGPSICASPTTARVSPASSKWGCRLGPPSSTRCAPPTAAR